MSDETPQQEGYNVTLESLAEKKEDTKASEAQYKALFIKPGTYRTVPPQDVRARVNAEGRTYISAFGTWMGFTGEAAGTEVKGQRVQMSPDEKKNDKGDLDFPFQTYVKAKKAYKDTIGEWPENAFQVAELLRTYPLLLDVRMGKDSPMVVNIRADKN